MTQKVNWSLHRTCLETKTKKYKFGRGKPDTMKNKSKVPSLWNFWNKDHLQARKQSQCWEKILSINLTKFLIKSGANTTGKIKWPYTTWKDLTNRSRLITKQATSTRQEATWKCWSWIEYLLRSTNANLAPRAVTWTGSQLWVAMNVKFLKSLSVRAASNSMIWIGTAILKLKIFAKESSRSK